MSPEKRCPRCRSVIPPLAASCLQCGFESQAVDDQRFSVVRKGQEFNPTPNVPLSPPVSAVPPEAARLKEGDPVWYCKIGGQTIGPVTAADIRDAFSKGQIDGNASVGIQGHKDWFPIRSLPQFADMVTGIGRPPTARPLPTPTAGGAALPSPQQPRRPPAPTGAPARVGAPQARPAQTPPPAQPAGATPAPAAAIGKPTSAPAADPDDETQVVPPLPPPAAVPGAQAEPGQIPAAAHLALQDEIAKLRRMVLALGVLSGVLLLSAATLLMLWLAG